MSIIDSWYCPQCGNHNVVGGIIAECFMCQTPRPAPTMRPTREQYLEQAAEVQKHLHLWRGECGHHWLKEESQDCPLCKLDQCKAELAFYDRKCPNCGDHLGLLAECPHCRDIEALKGELEAAEQHVKILREQSESYALRLEQSESEHEATKLRLAAAEESITGCARRVQALSSRLANGRALLDALCGQRHMSEMSDEDRENGDYEGAYDIFVTKVRELRDKLYPSRAVENQESESPAKYRGFHSFE